MLSVERLRVLCAVATHQSVAAAARSLNVSSSAVSQALAKLTKETRQELLVRDGRGVRLTGVGQLLADRAASLIDAVDLLEGDLNAFSDAVAGPVRIAAFPTAARGLGPALLLALHESYPELSPSLVEQEPTESLLLLARGEVDVVIAQDWSNAPRSVTPDVERLDLFDDIADIAVSDSHRLSRRRSVRLDELAGERWVTWPSGSICHDWLVHTYRAQGREPIIAHTASEHATQLALVAAGLGPAVIPRLGRGDVPDGVRLIAVEPALHRHVFVAWRANTVRRSNVHAVKDALVDVTTTSVSRRRSQPESKRRR
jgi:DNA-binding transcriptional LysR family regulator